MAHGSIGCGRWAGRPGSSPPSEWTACRTCSSPAALGSAPAVLIRPAESLHHAVDGVSAAEVSTPLDTTPAVPSPAAPHQLTPDKEASYTHTYVYRMPQI